MINPNAYYTVQGWMLSELKLKGNALAVYAIIYGFSQDGASEYAGTARYLAEWLGCSTRTVLSILSDLTEQGLLTKTTTYKNGQTFNNYAAAQNVKGPYEKISYPMKNFQGGSEKFSGGDMKNFQGGHEKISSHITRDNTRKINIEINKEGASAPPAPSGKVENDKKPVKHQHGEYKNVLLTDEEYAKLQKLFPDDLQERIERLSEYIASKGTKYKSHYATIRSWANRDGKQRAARPAPRGGYHGQVGPNGIAIDANNHDADAAF